MSFEISPYQFNQGLLLSARAQGAPDRFQADGKEFHDAFGKAIEFLNRGNGCVVPGLGYVRRDPVFGVYHEAGQLLLQGQYDLIIGLMSPSFEEAVFRVSREQAAKEIAEFEHAEWFRDLGLVFAEALGSVAQLD